MTRVMQFFGVGDPWVRPLPKRWLRTDLPIAALWFCVAALTFEASRSVGMLRGDTAPTWVEYAGLAVPCVAVIWRRRFPLCSVVVTVGSWVLFGEVGGLVTMTLGVQFVYFFSIYSATAWCRDRRRGVLVIGLCLAALAVWVVWTLVHAELPDRHLAGLLSPMAGRIVINILANSLYIGGSVLLGLLEWRNVRRRVALEAQARTIDEQARALREQAVVAERLRIARELHDVVAHHVSLIGVQAGAARRVFDKRPDAARTAMAGIEESSRSAVTEMRALLGTLRADGDETRAPAPGFADLERLVEEYRAAGLDVDFRLVDADPPLAGDLPPAIGLSIYRTAQEALANVRRHSTARSAQVVARLDRRDGEPYAEIEVLDGGLPVPGSGGTGLGLTGMRERVAAHGGEAEIGPRPTAGYRVRVRLPFAAGQRPAVRLE
ncbi:histidine kinase [Flexivirga sp. ID2601S]|uniref:Oxygen sensor histidine kinase NreB n=1 Tax=Flexivirga aerilata TaxID=1656889 RepID=A0A849AN33_9MICO|nr:histidine kinase [Flexivirga aerilata]NNG38212.1 histidine kinase [Flexivirga aerilata]